VREAASPFANDPFFSQFFGQIPRERVQNSLGSGVILRAEGVIVTNNHVINGAEEVTVALADRREFHAQITWPIRAPTLRFCGSIPRVKNYLSCPCAIL